MITELFEYVFVLSAATACAYIVLEKWGAIDWLQVHAPAFIPSECVFCLMFWFSFITTIPVMIFTPDISYLVAPFCAAPISKAIYENCKATGGK